MPSAPGSRPLIGVTTSEVRHAETVEPTPEGEPPRHEMALGLTYLRAIEAAGGLPVVIPPLHLDAIEPLLDRLSGICLSGGPDLDPVAYGQKPDEHLGPTEPDLDRFELAIASAADQREIPLLAICRGTQALNIVRGGTLVQHLPDVEREEPVQHRQRIPGDRGVPPDQDRRRRAAWRRRSTRPRRRSTPSTTRRSTGSATGSWRPPGPATARSRRSRIRAATTCSGCSGTPSC